MTRKRSKYRPRPVLANPVAYVLEGLEPVAPSTEMIRTRNNSALESLIRGDATRTDVGILITAANMTTALARIGKGRDWAVEIRAGVDALEAVRNRLAKWGKVQATPSELQSVATLIDVHDAQMSEVSDVAVTVADMEAAVRISRHMVATSGV